MKKRLLLLILILNALSCKRNIDSTETQIYTNDFESNNLSSIENGIVTRYNNNAVLGHYNSNANKGYFKLVLNQLPKHSLITLSFDLYIHDKWEGNKMSPNGPDFWQMTVDGDIFVNTTFSNEECTPGYFCSPQSYPANYPNSYNNPKSGAARIDLPGVCGIAGNNGTTLYKITKTFSHTNSTLTLQCADKLFQSDVTNQLCDESWSVDNIIIKAVTL